MKFISVSSQLRQRMEQEGHTLKVMDKWHEVRLPNPKWRGGDDMAMTSSDAIGKQKESDTVPTRHHPRTPPRSTSTTRTHGARRSIPLGAISGRDQSLLRRRSMDIILLTRLDCVEEFQLEHLAVKMVCRNSSSGSVRSLDRLRRRTVDPDGE